MVEALKGKTCQNSLPSGGGRSLGAKISGEGVVPGEYFFIYTKLDTFCYLTVQTPPFYVPSFWHNTGVWQTDGQTDGTAVASTALAMRTLWRTVKMLTLCSQAFSNPLWVRKFRQLVPLLTNRHISLIRRGRLYSNCVWRVCHTEVRPGLSGKKMRWHFSEQRWEWLDGCVMLR